MQEQTVKEYGDFSLVLTTNGFELLHNGVWVLDASIFGESKHIRLRTTPYTGDSVKTTKFVKDRNPNRGDNGYAVQYYLKGFPHR